MGLCFQTSRWLDRLWGEHLELSSPACDLVEAGIKKQGAPFAGFPADLHARLYLPSDPPPQDEAPSWASHLHSLASELGEWQRLHAMCKRNGFAAGVAAEVMLSHLLPHVPEPPPPSETERGGGKPGTPPPSETERGSSEPGSPPPGDASAPTPGDSNTPAPGSNGAPSSEAASPSNQPSDADIRASLRKAARSARDAVQEAESNLEGLGTPLGLSMPGTALVHDAGPAGLKRIREAHRRLGESHRMRRICELAGRLERISAAKARSEVKPGIGEVHGISHGSDLARLLPSELVALRHPRLRIHILSRVLQRRALTYGMKGKEPQGKGPIIVLLDESGSMRAGSKDIWAKAVCLALLSTATRQRRDWHLVSFNGAIIRETAIPVRAATLPLIQAALDHRCAGGTDFNAPIFRAVELLWHSPTMKKADVVIITDGEADLNPETIEVAKNLTRTEGVSWFAVGVGPDSDTELQSLAPIATSLVRVRETGDTDLIVPVINLST